MFKLNSRSVNLRIALRHVSALLVFWIGSVAGIKLLIRRLPTTGTRDVTFSIIIVRVTDLLWFYNSDRRKVWKRKYLFWYTFVLLDLSETDKISSKKMWTCVIRTKTCFITRWGNWKVSFSCRNCNNIKIQGNLANENSNDRKIHQLWSTELRRNEIDRSRHQLGMFSKILLTYFKSISLFPGEGNNISDMFGNRFLAWQHRNIILMWKISICLMFYPPTFTFYICAISSLSVFTWLKKQNKTKCRKNNRREFFLRL